jgi:hypothetical protein
MQKMMLMIKVKTKNQLKRKNMVKETDKNRLRIRKQTLLFKTQSFKVTLSRASHRIPWKKLLSQESQDQ